MQWLSIIAMEDVDEIKNRLYHEFYENIEIKESSHIQIKEEVNKNISIFHLVLNDGSWDVGEKLSFLQSINHRVAEIIVDIIIHFGKFRYIYKYLEKEYKSFTQEERDIICTRITKYFVYHQVEKKDILLQENFRNTMIERCEEVLDEKYKTSVEGFLIFRLKDYIKRLKQIVDQIVIEYLAEIEYSEFIQLLKYFVSIQEPKFKEIHIFPQSRKKYSLYNENNEDITQLCIEEFRSDMENLELNYDDLLVSSLVSNAPDKVIVHKVKEIQNKEMIQTLLQVFKERIEFDCEDEKMKKNPLDFF